MLRSSKQLFGYKLHATDGEIGHVSDLYFDDARWAVRYLVVDTGHFLHSRPVLVSPQAVANWDERMIYVDLTRQQVEDAPSVNTDLPVSRQEEAVLHSYYGWHPYWGGAGLLDANLAAIYPELYMDVMRGEPARPFNDSLVGQANGDPHLRSAREAIGYQAEATDGPIGHVEDMIVDDAGWTVTEFVVHTHLLMPGGKVIVAPTWVDEINWPGSRMYLKVAREQVQAAPKFDPSQPVATSMSR